jgi:hypothetical protein
MKAKNLTAGWRFNSHHRAFRPEFNLASELYQEHMPSRGNTSPGSHRLGAGLPRAEFGTMRFR